MGTKRIRICMNALPIPPTFGGIGNEAYHLLKGLSAAHPEWEFTLLVSEATAPHFRDLPGVRMKTVGIGSRLARLAYLHLVFPFLAARYDLVHSVGNMGMVLCPAAQIVTINDVYEHLSPERFSASKRTLMRMLISLSGRRAKRILTISDNTRKDLERFYPHFRGKISMVYLGNKFPIHREALPDGREGFLFVGTLEPGKNLPLVLKAFALYRGGPGAGKPAKLRVAGAKGWKQSDLPALIDSLGIAADVEFLGFVTDSQLEGEYGRALALIQASSYEGFGLPVIEAMACGCPVIAARNSALIEVGGDAALFFETGRVEELAALMGRVQGERELRAACLRKGLAHAAGFTWERTVEEVGKIFAAALPAGRDSR